MVLNVLHVFHVFHSKFLRTNWSWMKGPGSLVHLALFSFQSDTKASRILEFESRIVPEWVRRKVCLFTVDLDCCLPRHICPAAREFSWSRACGRLLDSELKCKLKDTTTSRARDNGCWKKDWAPQMWWECIGTHDRNCRLKNNQVNHFWSYR